MACLGSPSLCLTFPASSLNYVPTRRGKRTTGSAWVWGVPLSVGVFYYNTMVTQTINATELRLVLPERIGDLRLALKALDAMLLEAASADYPAWGSGLVFNTDADTEAGQVPADEDPATVWGQAREMIQKITYEDGQAPTASLIYPAVLGVPKEAFPLAEALNSAKKALHETLKAFDAFKVEAEDPDTGAVIKVPLLKAALENLNLRRLHRRQAVRQLVFVDHRPTGLSYYWNQLPKMTLWTRQEVFARLERLAVTCGMDSDQDMQRLAPIPANEILVEVKPPHVHPRLRITLPSGKLITRVAVMPVLVPAVAGQPLPDLVPLPIQPTTGNRLKRRDRQRESQPIIETLPLYRYRPQYRRYGVRGPNKKLEFYTQ